MKGGAGADLFSSEPGGAIRFPCVWHGSLMVQGGTLGTEGAVRSVLRCHGLSDGSVRPGNRSASGRYETWKISATVPDLATLESLFHGLESLPGVRMLL